MSKMKTFNEISTPDMLAMILRQTNRGDEALYYLLNTRLKKRLHISYSKYQRK